MKKAHVFKYSQVILTNREKTVAEFSKNSGLSMQTVAAIAEDEEKQGRVIDQYKTGKLTTEKFRTEMNKLITDKGGKAITDDKIFDNFWNAKCIVETKKLAELHELQQEHDFHIHIVSGTNKLQHNYIQGEIQQYKLDISYTLSYELGTLDSESLKENANSYLCNKGYEPVWHMQEQNEYEQNALKILGDYYGE